MRNSIFLIFFLLMSIVGFCQSEFNFNASNYGAFQVSRDAKCGIGNVYCIVTRSPYTNAYGNYVYQVYFATNSYFYNCNPARTYIPDIEILYFEGKNWWYPGGFTKFWMTVGQTTLAYTLFHPSPYLQIKIKTGFLEPTIY